MLPLQLSNGGFMGIMEMFILLDQSGSKMIEYPTVLESRLLGVSKMKTLSVIANHLGMIRELILSRPEVLRRAGATVPVACEHATEASRKVS
jgi:hypothetical protein